MKILWDMAGEAVLFAKVAMFVAVMALACVDDVRKREAGDVYWAALGMVAIVFMSVDAVADPSVWRALPILGSMAILIYLLWPGEEDPVHPIVLAMALALSFAVPAYMAWGDPFVRDTLAVPVLFLFFVLLYRIGAVKGGADVKCLITISMVFYTYPVTASTPLLGMPGGILSTLFPFALATLFFAALFSLAPIPFIALRNALRGDSGTLRSFHGYYMPIGKARESHVWPLQNVVDGTVVWTRHPQGDEGVYDALEAAGEERVWVTPKIPFLVPILAAVLFLVVVGNPLFLLI